MKRALLVIDVQNEYIDGKLPVTHPHDSLANITRAMDAAQQHGIPVIVIQHSSPQEDAKTFRKGSQEWQLHRQISEHPADHYVEKNLPSSFANTDLEPWLREHGIDTVTITGYMTQMCCDSTARDAFHRGFKVEFLSDATGTLTIHNAAGSVTAEELHRSILVTQAMRFSRVMTTEEWANALD